MKGAALHPSKVTASDPRYGPIRQIIKDIIDSIPNLLSLDISNTFLALQSDVLTTINTHPNLKTVVLEDAYQLCNLPSESSFDLTKIRCRQFKMPFSSWPSMPQYFLQARGAQLDSLYLSQFALNKLGDSTLSGLRSITIPTDADKFPSLSGTTFLERHTSLESITLECDGSAAPDLHSLSALSCLSVIFVEAEKRGLEDSLKFGGLQLSRVPPSPFDEGVDRAEWYISKAAIRITSLSRGSLPLFLRSLSYAQNIHIVKNSANDDFYPIVSLSCRTD